MQPAGAPPSVRSVAERRLFSSFVDTSAAAAPACRSKRRATALPSSTRRSNCPGTCCAPRRAHARPSGDARHENVCPWKTALGRQRAGRARAADAEAEPRRARRTATAVGGSRPATAALLVFVRAARALASFVEISTAGNDHAPVENNRRARRPRRRQSGSAARPRRVRRSSFAPLRCLQRLVVHAVDVEWQRGAAGQRRLHQRRPSATSPAASKSTPVRLGRRCSGGFCPNAAVAGRPRRHATRSRWSSRRRRAPRGDGGSGNPRTGPAATPRRRRTINRASSRAAGRV